MRLLVFGGRDFQGREDLFAALDWLDLNRVIDVVIEGEAPGADRLARRWAESRRAPFHPFPADWTRWGKPAGSIRNQQMLDEGVPSHALQCPGGIGTADMRRRLDRADVSVIELYDLLDRI